MGVRGLEFEVQLVRGSELGMAGKVRARKWRGSLLGESREKQYPSTGSGRACDAHILRATREPALVGRRCVILYTISGPLVKPKKSSKCQFHVYVPVGGGRGRGLRFAVSLNCRRVLLCGVDLRSQ